MASLSQLYNNAKQSVGNYFQGHVAQPVEQAAQTVPGKVANYFENQVNPMGTGVVGNAIDFANQHFATPVSNAAGTLVRSGVNAVLQPGVAQDGPTPQGMNQRQFNQGVVSDFNRQGQTGTLQNVAEMAGGALPYFIPGANSAVVGGTLGNQLGNNQTQGNLFSTDSLKDVAQAGLNSIPGMNNGEATAGLKAVPRLLANTTVAAGENVVRGQGSSLIETGHLDPKRVAMDTLAGGIGHGITHTGEIGGAVNESANYVRNSAQNAHDFNNLAAATHTYKAQVEDPHTTQINGVTVKDPSIQTNTTIRVPESQAEQILRNHNNVPPVVKDNNGGEVPGHMVDITLNSDRQVQSWTPESPAFTKHIVDSAQNGATFQGRQSGAINLTGETASGNPLSQINPETAAAVANHPNVPLTTDLPENTGTGSGLKERQFITRAKVSPDVSAEAQDQLEGNYTPRQNTELLQTVQNRIAATGAEASHDFALKNNTDEGTATAIELAKQYRAAGNHEQEAALINEKAKQLTEAGRTIQAAKLMKTLSPEGQAMTLARDINAYNEKNPSKQIPNLSAQQVKDITSMAEAVQAMPEGTKAEQDARGLAQQKLWEHMADQIPGRHSIIDKILAVRRTGLLTGPKTVIKVLGGHAIHGATESVSNVIATGIDKGIALAGGQRSTTLTGGDTGTAVKQGINNTGSTLIKGYDPNATYNSIKNNRIDWGSSAFGKMMQGYTEGIGRLHQALPEVARSVTTDASIHSQAGAAAENQGLKGQAKQDFIKQYVASPPENAVQTAHAEADHQTFQNSTRASELLTASKHIPVVGKAVEALVPFTRVPSAVGTEIVNYSPVGAVKTTVEALQAKGVNGWTPEVQRAFVQGIGRSITGTGLLYLGAKLAEHGLISPSYPTDQKTRNQWELEGRTPDSILIDGKWRSLGSFGPTGSALAIGAAWTAGLNGTQKKPGDYTKAAINTAGAAAQTQADQPYLQGISTVASVLKDPARSSLSFVKSNAASFVPTAVSTVASATDPLQRQTPTIGAAVASKIPVLREGLQPKVDAFGQPVHRGGSVMEGLLDPTNPSGSSTDASTGALSNLGDLGFGATPTKIGTTITIGKQKVPLSPDQQTALNGDIGAKIKDAYTQTLNTPGFQDQAPADQQQQLSNVAANVRKGVMTSITASGSVDNYLKGGASSAPVGTTGNSVVDAAQLDLAKKQVAAGTKTNVTLGDNYVTKDAKGTVVVKSISGMQAATQDAQYSSDLDSAKKANDLKTYSSVQKARLDELSQERTNLLKDPTLNSAALITNQKQASDITSTLNKYISQGYITKPKKSAASTAQTRINSINNAQYSLNLAEATRANDMTAYKAIQEQQLNSLSQQRDQLLHNPTANAVKLIENQNKIESIQSAVAGKTGGSLPGRSLTTKSLGGSSSRRSPGLGLSRSAGKIKVMGQHLVKVHAPKAGRIKNLKSA